MARTNKKFMLVGNWKMNPESLEEARTLFSAFERKAKRTPKASVVVCPPALFISTLAKSSKKCAIGVQDVDFRPKGAFTGFISAKQAKSAGAKYAIIGHSERRAAGDTDDIVAQKAIQALDAGLDVILCVGEQERDGNAHYLQSIRSQILAVFSKIDKNKVKMVTIAYEPVWAVGKDFSKALSPEGIHEMSIYIKKVVAETFGKAEGLKTKILYGGAVNPDNAEGIVSKGEIDGLLVGRQSLEVESFSKIIDYANGI